MNKGSNLTVNNYSESKLICNLISVLIIDRVPTRLLTFVGTLVDK